MPQVELANEIEIDAPPEKVWEVLVDFEKYPEWNKYYVHMETFEDELKVGSKLRPHVLIPPDENPTKGTVAISKFDENKCFQIKRSLGILTAVHTWDLEPTENGGTRVKRCEIVDGCIVGFIKGMLDRMDKGCKEGNDEPFKARCETT